MSGLAGRPMPVLTIATIAAAAIVAGAVALLPRLAGILGWPEPALQTLFAVLLYGTLAAVAGIGRQMARLGPGAPPTGMGAAGALGLTVGIGGFALTLGQAALSGSVARGEGVGSSGALLLLGTVVMVGQSAAEELFFRGWLQPVLQRGWGDRAAVLVTAIAFSALHVAGGARSPVTLVNLVLGGVLFGLLALRTGRLTAAIGAHAGWNWAEGIGLGLDPNPGIGSFGAIRDLDLVGAPWWGGSGEGLNASVAMTLVLAALILPLAIRPRRPAISPNRVPG